MSKQLSASVGGKTVVIETGKLAKQAGGSVTVRCGDTIVLVTACVKGEPKLGADFLPLTVDYIEKTFAAGKIPGGFFKREGRPSELATLTSRFIDRPVRPLFPEGYCHETQVIATVLSADQENESDILAITGASTALMLSEAPFLGPIAGVRIGQSEGQFVVNPNPEQMEKSTIDLIVVGSRKAIVMVEGWAAELPEAEVIGAIMFGHRAIQPLLDIQEELAKQFSKTKLVVTPPEVDADLVKQVHQKASASLRAAFAIGEKQKRNETLGKVKEETLAALVTEEEKETKPPLVAKALEDLEYEILRGTVLKTKKRIDGRAYDEIRSITCETGILPRAHGSALFTRGETQALVTTTLGSGDDEQIIDALKGEWTKKFMLHYNFPPFSVGETKPLRSPGRREIGHGALAERALRGMIPEEAKFPYTIRIVSEILESNGSSSMATVCGGALSLMDAGVPIKEPVAGIAMGLVKEGDEVAILSDILGDEDHLGDMDFKVTGTKNGVTALQMDIKIAGLDEKLLTKALEQARQGRLFILGKMMEALSAPRPDLSPYAPRITTVMIDKEMIGALIGPGGKNIRGIIEETGAQIEVEDDGAVKIFSSDGQAMEKAVEKVRACTAVAELGKIYNGKVVKIADFGAFVNILPNTDGLCHISELDYKRVNSVTDVVKEGDTVDVKVIRIEPSGKVALSLRQTRQPPEGWTPPPEREERPRRSFGDRGRGDGRRGGFGDRPQRGRH
ncbi:MAG: polyribonucleotide nucleotidyltransferase [Deltaproteobacteria bacterium]|nr:polyribonucleotide nucleotidyltransferase [Deltaproteobacteria bacterium]